MNAAAVFMIAGTVKDFGEGIELANQSIDSGKALNKLERLIEFTNAEPRYLRNPYEAGMEQDPQGYSQRS